MAFVEEEMPEEFIKENNVEFTRRWEIDRERDCILYYTGGNAKGPETTFNFIWKGEIMGVFAISRGGWDRVGCNGIQNKLTEEQEEIFDAIADGLIMHSCHGNTEYYMVRNKKIMMKGVMSVVFYSLGGKHRTYTFDFDTQEMAKTIHMTYEEVEIAAKEAREKYLAERKQNLIPIVQQKMREEDERIARENAETLARDQHNEDTK